MRLLSWNILQGGGRRADEIAKVLVTYNPDIITLQEFRDSSDKRGGKDEVMGALKTLDHKFIHIPETSGPHEHTILISSRFGFDAGPFLPDPISPLPMLEAYFSAEALGFELSLIAVHFPQKKAQVPLFQALKDDSESLLKMDALIIGDMNCGIPFVDSDSKTFASTQYYQDLLHAGWIDSWRRRHPDAREFTWVSPRTGNRFRYDQIMATPSFNDRIKSVEYDHTPREAEPRLSDHSLFIVDF